MNASRRRVAVAAGLVAAALAVLGTTPWGRSVAATLERRTAPERALGSPRLREALVRDGILAPRPPALAAGVTAFESGDATCPELELAPGPLAPGTAPSTRATPPEAAYASAPFVSLWLDPCRLARLHADPWAHGRASEETGWVSIWDGGRLRLETAVGVRIHGGVSRKDPPFSYRLYFRDAYGAPGAPASLLPGAPGDTLSRLVVAELDDHDRDDSPWPLPGETAYAVGRAAGAEVPATRAAWFALAGTAPRPVSLVEPIGADFLRRRYGHDDFDLVRGKRDPDDPATALFEAELAWIAAEPAPLRMATAAARYDLDSLLAWLVTVVVNGTGDLYQDAMVRDRTGEARDGRWFWIHWDHDMSFRTPPRNSRFGRFRDAFYAVVWSERDSDRGPARSLLGRLLVEDPEFRERVRARFDRAFAAELTPAFFAATVDGVERDARRLGFTDLHFAAYLRRFFADRPAEVRAQVDEVLAAVADPDLARPPGIVRFRQRVESREGPPSPP